MVSCLYGSLQTTSAKIEELRELMAVSLELWSCNDCSKAQASPEKLELDFSH